MASSQTTRRPRQLKVERSVYHMALTRILNYLSLGNLYTDVTEDELVENALHSDKSSPNSLYYVDSDELIDLIKEGVAKKYYNFDSTTGVYKIAARGTKYLNAICNMESMVNYGIDISVPD